jgi:hypothetical protein
MATLICFHDDDRAVLVSESPVEVQEAFSAGHGSPFVVHRDKDGSDVFVNPSAISHWYEKQAQRSAGF